MSYAVTFRWMQQLCRCLEVTHARYKGTRADYPSLGLQTKKTFLLCCRRSQEDTDRDFFMTPQEALDYGLIDEVIKTKTSHLPLPQMPFLE